MAYRSLNNFDEDKWSAYVNSHPNGHLFYIPAIYNIYKTTKRLSPLLIIIVNDDNEIAGLALGEISDEIFSFFGLTTRTTFYAEPLYNGDVEVLKLILKTIREKAKGLFVEIRMGDFLNEDEKNIYQSFKFVFKDHLNSLILLTSEEKNWNNISSDKKQGIRDAKKNNILVIEKNDREGMKICFTLLKDLYFRKRHFIKSENYFMNLLGMPNFRVLIAYLNDEPIATQLFYVYRDTITAYYTATKKEYMNKHAGDLLIWKLIEIGLEEGCHIFDLGGAGNPDGYNGIREYKRGFGTKFNNVGRYIYQRSLFYSFAKNIYSLILKS